jgi:ribonuclease P protein component
MVPKGHRLCRDESSRVDREGFRASEGSIQAKILPIPGARGPRYVVIAGKSASKSSVDRHTIRRRMSAAIETILTESGFLGDVIVRVRSDVSKTPFDVLLATCRALLARR